jgi:hypothetical protein
LEKSCREVIFISDASFGKFSLLRKGFAQVAFVHRVARRCSNNRTGNGARMVRFASTIPTYFIGNK